MADVFAGGNKYDKSGTASNQSEYDQQDEKQIQEELKGTRQTQTGAATQPAVQPAKALHDAAGGMADAAPVTFNVAANATPGMYSVIADALPGMFNVAEDTTPGMFNVAANATPGTYSVIPDATPGADSGAVDATPGMDVPPPADA